MSVIRYSLVARDWLNLEYIINDLTQRVVGQEVHPTSSPTFGSGTITGNLDVGGDLDLTGTLTLTDLTASRLVATNASKELVSSDLNSWVTGTSNQVTVTDDADGTVTLSTPQDIHTGASPTFAGLDLTGITDGNIPYMSASGFADSSLSYDGTDIVIQPTADSTTAFQVLDADGGTPVLNVDSTNERVGIGTATPSLPLEVAGSIKLNSSTLTNYINSVNSGGQVAFGSSSGAFLVATNVADLYSGGIRLYVESAGVGIATNNLIGGIGMVVDQGSSAGDTIANMMALRRTTNATAAAGLGGGHAFYIDNDAGNSVYAASFGAVWSSAVAGDEESALYFSTRYLSESSPSEKMRLNAYGYLGLNETAPETLLELTHTTPYITLHNNTHEDSDGGRESRLNFKGEQSGGEETTLARIEASHDGAADDQKGKIVISTNDGSDDDTPTARMTIDSAGATDVVGDFTAGTIQADNGVSGTLELDDGTTEKITLVFTGGILTSRTVEATTGSALSDWTD